MNRRGFFKRTLGAIAAATVAPLLKFAAPAKPITLFDGPITFQGIPIVFSKYCPPNAIYFINQKSLAVKPYAFGEWENPFNGYDSDVVVVKPERVRA